MNKPHTYCKNGHLLLTTRRGDTKGDGHCHVCKLLRQKTYRKENPEVVMTYREKYYQHGGKEAIRRWYDSGGKEKQIALKCRNREVWLVFLSSLNMISCRRCGYDKCFSAIDFHHIDPKKKEMNIGNVLDKKIIDKRIEEVKKTITLCRNCHMELHRGLWSLEDLNTTEDEN